MSPSLDVMGELTVVHAIHKQTNKSFMVVKTKAAVNSKLKMKALLHDLSLLLRWAISLNFTANQLALYATYM